MDISHAMPKQGSPTLMEAHHASFHSLLASVQCGHSIQCAPSIQWAHSINLMLPVFHSTLRTLKNDVYSTDLMGASFTCMGNNVANTINSIIPGLDIVQHNDSSKGSDTDFGFMEMLQQVHFAPDGVPFYRSEKMTDNPTCLSLLDLRVTVLCAYIYICGMTSTCTLSAHYVLPRLCPQ